jgi:hypothetical protein
MSQQGTQALNPLVDGLEFSAAEWQQLDSTERVRRCREFAEQAKQLSAQAAPDVKRSYLELSQHWQVLADEIEHYTRETPQAQIGI